MKRLLVAIIEFWADHMGLVAILLITILVLMVFFSHVNWFDSKADNPDLYIDGGVEFVDESSDPRVAGNIMWYMKAQDDLNLEITMAEGSTLALRIDLPTLNEALTVYVADNHIQRVEMPFNTLFVRGTVEWIEKEESSIKVIDASARLANHPEYPIHGNMCTEHERCSLH